MRYLMDTDHCSHLQCGHPLVVKHLQSLPADAEVVTSVITQAELLVGIHQAPTPQRQEELRALYEWLITSISDILPVTTNVAELFAVIAVGLKRKGKPIPINDIWIAAIALANECILVSGDEHFRLIDGLQVEDWTKPKIGEGENP